jgi:allophanate hydrolase subunit 1
MAGPESGPYDSDDRAFGHDVVWQQTLDGGAYTLRVTRIDEDHGRLQVSVTDGVQLHEQEVPLAYGALFGPDMGDVADWQEITVNVVDEYINQPPQESQ